jgi:hypothetical protein
MRKDYAHTGTGTRSADSVSFDVWTPCRTHASVKVEKRIHQLEDHSTYNYDDRKPLHFTSFTENSSSRYVCLAIFSHRK